MSKKAEPKGGGDAMYCVYMHTNKTNGKRYFGITRQVPKRRWQKGKGYDSTYFGHAISKYGWDGFIHEVLCDKLSKGCACEIEIYLISFFHTDNREKGYNISKGGQTCDCCMGKKGIEHPNHVRVKMIDPETNVVIRVFNAQSEAAREMGINRKGITKACQGINRIYKGYIWEYADIEYKKPKHPGTGNYEHSKHKKSIVMYDTDGKKYVFESVKKAAEVLGIRPSTISRYLVGSRTDRSGRRWCYA
jgi:predicted GIY-YIG superfamily endonuclease